MINAVYYSSSLPRSLAITFWYILIPLLIATFLGTLIALNLCASTFYKPSGQKSRGYRVIRFLLSVIAFFPFSFLFFAFVSFLAKPFSTPLALWVPLVPLSFIACANFSLQVEGLCAQGCGRELEMAQSVGISKKAIMHKVLLPKIKKELPEFMLTTAIALLPAIVIVGTASGLDLGGHFFLSWATAKAAPSLWLIDLGIMFLLVALLLIARYYVRKGKNKQQQNAGC